ncbi:MAG: D-2-hydroxyacid dehydrogenase [Chitinophagales bacterium]
MKIVVLDGYTLNPGDLSWKEMEQLGKVEIFERTPSFLTISRCQEASVVVTNKVVMSAAIMEALPKLQLIVVTATGYNVVDIEAAKKKGITVCNAPNYSTTAVAQHVFALLLALTNKVASYHQSVRNGMWENAQDWTYSLESIVELSGKKMGIIGLGKIGQATAKIALTFGMQVIAFHRHPERDAMEGVTFVDLNTLIIQSDVISLHVPSTKQTTKMVNQAFLEQMKPNSVLINTARGQLIDEPILAAALNQGKIAGAALDVLSNEPPKANNPLLKAKNCIITPHRAWGSMASRQRLLNISLENIRAYKRGRPQNVV